MLFGAEATCGAGFVAAAGGATGLTPDGTGVGEAGFADGAVAVCCAGETDDGLGAGVAAAGAVVVAATTAVEELIQEKDLVEIGSLNGVYEEYWAVAAEKKIPHPITNKLMQTLTVSA